MRRLANEGFERLSAGVELPFLEWQGTEAQDFLAYLRRDLTTSTALTAKFSPPPLDSS